MTLGEILSRFQGRRALVVGDLMLDEYIFGQATRISQEAPVMVVRQSGTRAVPGGAANVAGNMVAMGAWVTMVGVVGEDVPGAMLASSLETFGVEAILVRDASRPTTRKTRILANHAHQVLRVDHEDETPVSGAAEEEMLARSLAAMRDVDVVLISDYTKGAVTGRIIRGIVEEGRRLSVPVVANPKPRSLPYYEGAALVSLNRYEAGNAVGLGRGVTAEEAEGVARELRERLGVGQIVVTLGGDGMAAAGETSFHIPAVPVEVYDEAGAGDTVIATVALGIGTDAFSRELLVLATHTAAAVIRKVGVAVPSAEDLAQISRLA